MLSPRCQKYQRYQMYLGEGASTMVHREHQEHVEHYQASGRPHVFYACHTPLILGHKKTPDRSLGFKTKNKQKLSHITKDHMN
jgi:hypothetical protein